MSRFRKVPSDRNIKLKLEMFEIRPLWKLGLPALAALPTAGTTTMGTLNRHNHQVIRMMLSGLGFLVSHKSLASSQKWFLKTTAISFHWTSLCRLERLRLVIIPPFRSDIHPMAKLSSI